MDLYETLRGWRVKKAVDNTVDNALQCEWPWLDPQYHMWSLKVLPQVMPEHNSLNKPKHYPVWLPLQ